MKAIETIASEFPILQNNVVFLDTGASAQKPRCVIEAVSDLYQHHYANVHRGVYRLSEEATAIYEGGRDKARAFINAAEREEIIFTKGTTESINLLAQSLGRLTVNAGDEVLISAMEHHSNIVPWQMLCQQTGAHLKVVNMQPNGELDLANYQQLLSDKTRIVAITHVSNVLGTINPVKKMIEWAHQVGSLVLLDGAQAIPRMPVDVRALDCDFYVFSSHKMYGPTGLGILYGKRRYLDAMPPYQGGGDMIRQVSFEKTEYNDLPYKFEAGTPNIAGVAGFSAAIDFLQQLGLSAISEHEIALTDYAMQKLQTIPGLTIYGHAQHKIGVIAFTLADIHPHDLGTILDSEGVAIRAGHHCAMPLMEYYKVPAMARISLGVYNTKADIDAAFAALHKAMSLFGVA